MPVPLATPRMVHPQCALDRIERNSLGALVKASTKFGYLEKSTQIRHFDSCTTVRPYGGEKEALSRLRVPNNGLLSLGRQAYHHTARDEATIIPH